MSGVKMGLSFYEKQLKVHTLDEVSTHFRETIIKTNRSPEFFVDWRKVKANVDSISKELALWSSLVNQRPIKKKFEELITEYPEVLRTMPILFAIRDLELPIVYDFLSKESLKEFNFDRRRGDKLSPQEITEFVTLAERTGILQLFSVVRNFYDYVLGVEVGMDTNARKNRSGDVMEAAIAPIIGSLSKSIGFDYVSQKKFSFAGDRFGLKIPPELISRKSDFILHKNGKCVNIEVNYYSAAGSKPEEIVDSYINRRNELAAAGWGFIWITDGDVWTTSQNQLKKGFEKIDYLLNLDFVGKGMLEAALKEFFSK